VASGGAFVATPLLLLLLIRSQKRTKRNNNVAQIVNGRVEGENRLFIISLGCVVDLI